MNAFKKVLMMTGVLGATALTPAFGAWCPVSPSTPNIKPHFETLRATVNQSYVATDKAIAKAIETRNDKLLQAFKTYNAQKVASAEELGIQMAKNTQLIADIEQGIQQGVQIAQMTEEYSSRGLGYNLCHVMAQQRDVAKTEKQTESLVGEMTRNEVSASAGRYYPRTNSMAMRVATHEELYCTADQKASGLCNKIGRRAGKNLEAGTMFANAKMGSDEYNDKSAFVDNIIGFPDDPLPTQHLDTVVGVAYQDLKRRKDAGKSIASYSLKYIQARYSEVIDDHDHSHSDGDGHSHDDKVTVSEQARLETAKDATVAKEQTVESQKANNGSFMHKLMTEQERYFGAGEEYKEWSKYLVGATEKGVIQEQIKIEALNMKAMHEQLKLNHLMEQNIAALIAVEMYNSGAETEIEKMRQTITVNNVGSITEYGKED